MLVFSEGCTCFQANSANILPNIEVLWFFRLKSDSDFGIHDSMLQ